MVIPAYKRRFLAETLRSLDKQTNQRFRIYIGDDSSPEELQTVINGDPPKVPWRYVRFNENLGQRALTEHWDRCVDLSTEPWICLLGDDDILEERCIEAFYEELRRTSARFDVYRFNLSIIDENGEVTKRYDELPREETADAFLRGFLKGHRNVRAADHIFSRTAFEREQGFVSFPTGMWADVASWAAFGSETGIRSIPDPRLRWRFSSASISSANLAYREKGITALCEFAEWQARWFRERQSGGQIDDSASRRWFYWSLSIWRAPLSPAEGRTVASFAARFWSDPVSVHRILVWLFNLAWHIRANRWVHHCWSAVYRMRLFFLKRMT